MQSSHMILQIPLPLTISTKGAPPMTTQGQLFRAVVPMVMHDVIIMSDQMARTEIYSYSHTETDKYATLEN